MEIYWWEHIVVCHYPDKSCNHKHCDSGDITFLICHVTSREHMFKWLYEFIKPLTMGQHLAKFGGHWSNASGDIKYLICHVTSQKQATEAQNNLKLFMVYVTNFPRLVATAIAVVFNLSHD